MNTCALDLFLQYFLTYMILRSLMIKKQSNSIMCISFVHAYFLFTWYFRLLLHTQESEPGSRVFVTTYYGFPIIKATHIGGLSLLFIVMDNSNTLIPVGLHGPDRIGNRITNQIRIRLPRNLLALPIRQYKYRHWKSLKEMVVSISCTQAGVLIEMQKRGALTLSPKAVYSLIQFKSSSIKTVNFSTSDPSPKFFLTNLLFSPAPSEFMTMHLFTISSSTPPLQSLCMALRSSDDLGRGSVIITA